MTRYDALTVVVPTPVARTSPKDTVATDVVDDCHVARFVTSWPPDSSVSCTLGLTSPSVTTPVIDSGCDCVPVGAAGWLPLQDS